MRCWPFRRRSKSADQDSAWNRFVHQELKGYSPIMTGNRVLAFFLVATVILIPLGAAILAASLSVTEYKIRYDNVGPGFDSNDKSVQQRALWAGAGNQSTVTFTTTKRLKAPVSGMTDNVVLLHGTWSNPQASQVVMLQVFLYYELQRYYQNHKR